MTDFYRGWMIEIRTVGTQFQFVCHSPSGEKLGDEQLYPTELSALRAGFFSVDQFLACAAIRTWLRDLFEADRLEFAEWKQLSQSLNQAAGVRFR